LVTCGIVNHVGIQKMNKFDDNGYQVCPRCGGNSIVQEFVYTSDGIDEYKAVRYSCLDCLRRWYKKLAKVEAKDE